MMSLPVWLPSPILLLGGLCLWSHVPCGGSLPGGSRWGVSVLGISVQRVLCQGGLCPGVLDISHGEIKQRTYFLKTFY